MQLTLKAGSTTLSNFTEARLNLKYAAIGSTFEFKMYFDRTNEAHRKVLKPLSFQPVIILVNGKKVIDGTIINIVHPSSEKKELSTIIGYSKTGVLTNCTIPIEIFPAEFNGLSIRTIIEKIIGPFGLKLETDLAEVDETIQEINTEPTTKIEAFIVDMLAQKNLILSHDENGNLTVKKPELKNNLEASFLYTDGTADKMTLSVNGQAVHSQITTLKQSQIENDNTGQQTIENALVNAFRPSIVVQDFGDDITTGKKAEQQRAAELRNVKLSINTKSWFWKQNNGSLQLMKPNNIIEVLNPEIFIKKKARFVVEEVELIKTANEEKGSLKCVLPEVYNGQEPQNIFE